MKEILYQATTMTPLDYPCRIPLLSADNIPMIATVEDVGSHYELWLHIPSTDEKAMIAKFTSSIAVGVILGEIERKYESVFAHVVHHRLTIPIVGESIYENIPPFP